MRLYDETVGSGSPVVFFPGAGWPGRAGLNIGEALQNEYHFLMVDLPGYGRTEGIAPPVSERAIAEWAASYLNARNLSQAHVVGHSLGAYIALVFTHHYPTRVSSLTLLDMGHQRLPRLHSQPGAFGCMVPAISAVERLVGVQRLSRLLDRLNDPEDHTATLEHRMETCRRKGWYALEDDYYLHEALSYEPVLTSAGLALLLALYRANPPRLLAGVAAPTLLVYGTTPSQPPKVQRKTEQSVQRLLRHNPHIQAIGVNGGHYVHWADPSVVGSVADHIRSAS